MVLIGCMMVKVWMILFGRVVLSLVVVLMVVCVVLFIWVDIIRKWMLCG